MAALVILVYKIIGGKVVPELMRGKFKGQTLLHVSCHTFYGSAGNRLAVDGEKDHRQVIRPDREIFF